MSKDLFCTKCHCKVAEIEAGSKLMVGMVILCPRCSATTTSSNREYSSRSEVDFLQQLFGMK